MSAQWSHSSGQAGQSGWWRRRLSLLPRDHAGRRHARGDHGSTGGGRPQVAESQSGTGTAEATGDVSSPGKGGAALLRGWGGQRVSTPLQMCKRAERKLAPWRSKTTMWGPHFSSHSLTPTPHEEVGDIWETHRGRWADRQTDGGESISIQNPLLQSN